MITLGQKLTMDSGLCGECGGCVPVCPSDALYLSSSVLVIDHDVCTLCGDCVSICPVGALEIIDE